MNFRSLTIIATVALAACSPGPAAAPPLEGAKIGGPFSLTDQDGHTVTDKSLGTNWRIMYFGYTYCPDVCPTTAQTIGAAMRELDKSDPTVSAKVTPVFVTVDPDRDTPAVLKQFVSAFYPRFIGLTGSGNAITMAAAEYGVFAAKGKVQPGGAYLVQHSNAAYLMDPTNKPIALLPTDQGAAATAQEIKRWVK